MTIYTAADGTIYQTVTASSVSRAISRLGYEKRDQGGLGFRVDTNNGWISASNIGNANYDSDFSADIYRAGFDFQIEDSFTNADGNQVTILAIIARRIGKVAA